MAQIHTNLFASDIQVLIKALSSFFGVFFWLFSIYACYEKNAKNYTIFFKRIYLLISQQILTAKSFQIQCKSVDYHQFSLKNILLFSKISLPPVIKKMLKTTQFFKSKYLLISPRIYLMTQSVQIKCNNG